MFVFGIWASFVSANAQRPGYFAESECRNETHYSVSMAQLKKDVEKSEE